MLLGYLALPQLSGFCVRFAISVAVWHSVSIHVNTIVINPIHILSSITFSLFMTFLVLRGHPQAGRRNVM